MLHLTNKRYGEKILPIRKYFSSYRKKKNRKLTEIEFSKVLTAFGRHAADYMCTTGEDIHLPFIGSFRFRELTALEYMERLGHPPIDAKAMYKHMVEDKVKYPDINYSNFYTDSSKVIAIWTRKRPFGGHLNAIMYSYTCNFNRQLTRRINNLVTNKELKLKRL